MHLIGSYLDFKRISVVAYYRSMKRLIHIRLWHSYIVFEFARYRLPHCVDYAKYSIAVLDRLYNYSDCSKVKDFIELLVLIFHLAVDAVKVLGTAHDFTFDIEIVEGFLNLSYNLIYYSLPFAFSCAYLFGKLIVGFRLQIFKGNILHLELHSVYSEPAGKRSVDFKCFSALFFNLLLCHIVDCSEIVKPVRQLYN